MAFWFAVTSTELTIVSVHARTPRGSSRHEEAAAAVPGESYVKGQEKVSMFHIY